MTETIIFSISAFVCAALLSFALTPIARVIAYKVGAIDVPKDKRRMHKHAVPLIGGLAIFVAFTITSLIFCNFSKEYFLLLGGALIITIVGFIDDVISLPPLIKLVGELAAALVVVLGGIRIQYLTLFGQYVDLGWVSIPLSLLWVVGLTNAINLIDGLDGLSCGVSMISSISILAVILLQGGDFSSAIITLILIGSCLGFIPYNRNPAKIFMGDTGALFLGFTLSVIAIQGMLKLHTIISIFVPLLIFALPLADTLFAIIRRVIHGKSPFEADRGHLHHRLVDMGFTQKETVKILYSICGLLGLVAVSMCDNMFSTHKIVKSVAIAITAILVFIIYSSILKNPKNRIRTGLLDDNKNINELKKKAVADQNADQNHPSQNQGGFNNGKEEKKD